MLGNLFQRLSVEPKHIADSSGGGQRHQLQMIGAATAEQQHEYARQAVQEQHISNHPRFRNSLKKV